MWALSKKLALLLGLILTASWLFLVRPIFLPLPARKAFLIPADAARLSRHTKKLAVELVPRDWKSVDNLNKTAEYIAEELRSAGSTVRFQNFRSNGAEYRNVIAEFGAPGPSGTIVIGAHYDAFGEFPGADDNASGAAGLMELGRILSTEQFPFKIILAAYSLEEPPFYTKGSAVHAESLLRGNEKVRLMISLEMIGYFSDEENSQAYPLPFLKLLYPSRGDFIAIVGPLTFSSATTKLKKAFKETVPLPVASINAPRSLPGIDFSDHKSFWERGFDAVMITDTAFYRNAAYHTSFDVPERLNYEKMAQVVTGVFSYLLELKEEQATSY